MKRARWLKIGVHKKFSNFGSQGRRRERAEAKGRGREGERERKRIDGAMEGRARSYVGSTPRLRATRIHEWDETRSNNLIYEYFAATRIVRASFEYSGIVLLVAYGNIRARPQYLNNARKLLLLVPYFSILPLRRRRFRAKGESTGWICSEEKFVWRWVWKGQFLGQGLIIRECEVLYNWSREIVYRIKKGKRRKKGLDMNFKIHVSTHIS